jgi:anti-sigma B factor antagonist
VKMKDSLEGDIAVLALSGKIMGGPDATFFHGKIHEFLTLNKRKFIVDLANVEWSNSVGIGMLIAGLTSVVKERGRLVLANITNIRNLLAMTRLLRVFECYDSVEEAKQALAEPELPRAEGEV